MKKAIYFNKERILYDGDFSDEVRNVLACKARKRDVDMSKLSSKTLLDIGLCLYYGYRIRKNHNKAGNYFLLCTDKGNPEHAGIAAYYAGIIWEESNLIMKKWSNRELSLDWTKHSCSDHCSFLIYEVSKKFNFPGGIYRLGLCQLEYTDSGLHDIDSGIANIIKAAEDGWLEAQQFIADYFENGVFLKEKYYLEDVSPKMKELIDRFKLEFV